jgi:hypothetical protein
MVRGARRAALCIAGLGVLFCARRAECCTRVRVQSKLFPFVSDEYVLSSYGASEEDGPIYHFNGRPIYESASDGPTRYLYHIQVRC